MVYIWAGEADGVAFLYSLSAGPLITAVLFCAVSVTAVTAMDRRQFTNVPLEVREWFEHLRSPTGVAYCSHADGHRTGYDMRQGQYWVPIRGEWYAVPPEAVIKTANPVGEANVWNTQVSFQQLCFQHIGSFALSRRMASESVRQSQLTLAKFTAIRRRHRQGIITKLSKC